VPEEKMMKYLWGDHYYDPEAKKWTSSNVSVGGKSLMRGFAQFVLRPLKQLLDCIINEKREQLTKMLSNLNISLKPDEMEQSGKKLMRTVMQKFLPASDALLEMICIHLPNPRKAQFYRCDTLYNGPLDDTWATAIKKCEQDGPLVMYVSKLVPTSDNSRFFAFGRVFSGTIKGGQKVRIMGSNYEHGEKGDVTVKNVQRTVLMMGRFIETVEGVSCGNVVGLVGVDGFIVKTATIVDEEAKDAYPLKAMKYSVSPVVRVAVEPKTPADLPKLVEGLKRLSKSDPLVQISVEESGEHIVAGAGELHLEICLKDLQDDFMGGAPLKISEPVVPFRETVTAESSIDCLSKSPNKHNRLYCKAVPMDEELVKLIEDGKITPRDDPKVRGKELAEKFGWDINDARKVWCFGPENSGPNLLVDTTKAVQYLNEIKDACVSGFQWASKTGVLADEPMRGIRYNLMDVVLHADSIHRGAGQIMPTMRRVLYASQLTAEPRLQEPVYLVDIQVPEHAMGGIYGVLNKRRGRVIGEENRAGTPLYNVRAYLPVCESFNFTSDLRAATAGQAFPQCVFDHYQLLPGAPEEKETKQWEMVQKTRKRKGLNVALPSLDDFYDKL